MRRAKAKYNYALQARKTRTQCDDDGNIFPSDQSYISDQFTAVSVSVSANLYGRKFDSCRVEELADELPRRLCKRARQM